MEAEFGIWIFVAFGIWHLAAVFQAILHVTYVDPGLPNS